MAKPDLGTKRSCLSCGAKFYDLNRDPILCPKCGAPFLVAALSRLRAEAKTEDDEEDDLPIASGPDFVPLEAVDEEDPAKAVPDDLEIEDAVIGDDDDDTFLETEEDEDDGDVSGLIDGDLEEDEES